jgi:hypothetical protein
MSVARTGLPHTSRTPRAEDRSGDGDPTATAVSQPQLPATLLGAQVVHGGERGGPARRAAVSETRGGQAEASKVMPGGPPATAPDGRSP